MPLARSVVQIRFQTIKFADDTKIYLEIRDDCQAIQLQHDIDQQFCPWDTIPNERNTVWGKKTAWKSGI